MRGVQRLRRTARRLLHAWSPRALVLMYHRVANLPTDPQRLAVTPEHFAVHLEIVRRYAQPLRLAELAEALQGDRLPPRAVTLTLDDGYVDSLENARPILEQFEMPATVFVTMGQLRCQSEFWWDELDRLLLQPGTLPATLRLDVGGRSYAWELGTAATYDEDAFQRHRGWHVERPDDPTTRQRLYRSLHRLLQPLPGAEQRTILNDLAAWAGLDSGARPSHRTLTADEVIDLRAGGLIELGAHTMSHPALPVLSEATQRNEIEQSKIQLEQLVGQAVTAFAYPYGLISPATVGIVRTAGFRYACSTAPGLVWPRADCLQLPRFAVRDCDPVRFEDQLKAWIRG